MSHLILPKDERWRRVEDLCHAALDVPPVARSQFLENHCGGDDALRHDVESLIEHSAAASRSLNGRAIDVAARLVAEKPAHEMIGRRVGAYQLVGLLGTGGMGEVFRARDTTLGRDVAIKILPAAFASLPDRVIRFEREARLLAALNHPHIAAIYGLEQTDGVHAIVLELVDGVTLAEKLAAPTGAHIPVAEVLNIAGQIADALDAAHEKAIVHRDLKPANIKITSDGVVKVLDFGIAKALAPTTASDGTQEGVVLGTPCYMSPEQSRGTPIDRRTDMWAFGCVLYEMLTGTRAFTAEADVPDWHALPADTPISIRILLRRLLDVDRKRRLDSAADARLEIEDARTEIGAQPAKLKKSKMWLPLSAGGAAAALLLAGVLAWRAMDPSLHRLVYASLDAPVDSVLGENDPSAPLPTRPPMVFTTDGQSLIILATRAGTSQLFLRSLDRPDARPIAGTEHARVPFVSPDGKWIGFWAADAAELRKVLIEGGAPTTISPLNAALGPNGASWGAGDVIVFGDDASGRIMRVSANGGTPVPVTANPGPARQHVTPFLLTGDRMLFSDVSRRDATDARVMVQALSSTDPRLVVASATDGRVLPSGELAFMRLGTLMTMPFDLARAEVTGDATPAMSRVMQSGLTARAGAEMTGAGMFAVSNAGALAVVRGDLTGSTHSRLIWVGRDGQSVSAEPTSGSPAGFRMNTRISPDGSRAVVTIWTPMRVVTWLADWTRDVWIACEECRSDRGTPVWSPDSRRLLVNRNDSLVAHSLDGTSDEVLLREADRSLAPNAWLADGRIVYRSFSDRTSGASEIKYLDPEGRAGILVPFASGDADVSRDGRWIAYASGPVGQTNVVVQAFPVSASRTQVSAGGGRNPAWASDGRTLYYLDIGAPGTTAVFAVDIIAGGGITAGTPRVLFRRSDGQAAATARSYDISANGPRFLFKDRSTVPRAAVTRMDLVLNWTATLPLAR
jgi:serine/threonine protein kinase